MIYVTGDTHGSLNIRKLSNKNFKEGKNLTKDDYVIILGDFGIVWRNEKETLYWLNWLDKLPFTTLFIEGNHENFPKLNLYPTKTWNGGEISVLSDSVFHLRRGQVFNINQKKFFTMGGANSIDKIYRQDGISWWKEEIPNKAEQDIGLLNLEEHNNKVDFILTHDCSEKVFDYLKCFFNYGIVENNSLRKYLDIIRKKVEFKHWYFGHFHEDFEVSPRYTLVYHKFIKLEE